MKQKINKISLIGAGTMGTQISIQAASYGYEVRIFDLAPENFQKTLQNLRGLMKSSGRMPTIPFEEWEKGAGRVRMCKDLSEALKEAAIVIEALPENLDLKRKIFTQIDSLSSQEAILATNSSSIPISKIESATKRPEKCLNIHFYQPALGMTMVDIMGGTKTTVKTMEEGKLFIKSVGCVPLTVKKEILGFCFNGVLRSIRRQILFMWAGGYVDFRDIDRAWMIFTKMPRGPFGIMDAIGLDVVYDIEMVFYNDSQDPKEHPPQALKDMIDRKELGIKTGKGFYTYPNPEFSKPDFLRG